MGLIFEDSCDKQDVVLSGVIKVTNLSWLSTVFLRAIQAIQRWIKN